jgi:hypothetical protein
MEGKRVFDFCRSILVDSLDIQDSSIKFIELDASENDPKNLRQQLEPCAPRWLDPEMHHRSPGQHVDGRSLAEIPVDLRATRWLRLKELNRAGFAGGHLV